LGQIKKKQEAQLRTTNADKTRVKETSGKEEEEGEEE